MCFKHPCVLYKGGGTGYCSSSLCCCSTVQAFFSALIFLVLWLVLASYQLLPLRWKIWPFPSVFLLLFLPPFLFFAPLFLTSVSASKSRGKPAACMPEQAVGRWENSLLHSVHTLCCCLPVRWPFDHGDLINGAPEMGSGGEMVSSERFVLTFFCSWSYTSPT